MQVANGKTVSFHYIGTLDNGDEFDNSYTRGEPLVGPVGAGALIPGFESALIGMKEGEKKTVVIDAKNAYGEHSEEAVQSFPLTSFPEDFAPVLGEAVQGQLGDQMFNAKIVNFSDQDVTLDFNHPLAGEDLNFEIEVVAIAETAQFQQIASFIVYPKFFQTIAGRSFFEGQLPRLIKALEKIGMELERYNDAIKSEKKEENLDV